MMPFESLSDAVIRGDRARAAQLTQEFILEEADPRDILAALVSGMDVVGDRFQRNEAFVPEMLIAARAMKESLVHLEPVLVRAGIKPEHTAVIGTVQGDLHDIGKNLVAAMLEGGGFDVVDLGVDVSPDAFVTAAKEKGATLIALSALLTTTMPAMKKVVTALQEAGLRDQVKVMIGGAPITQRYADEIGADGYSDNASGAVALARSLVARVPAAA